MINLIVNLFRKPIHGFFSLIRQSLQQEVSSRLDVALIKLGPNYSCHFKAPPIPVYCIPRVKRNNKELVFKQHAQALLSSFEA